MILGNSFEVKIAKISGKIGHSKHEIPYIAKDIPSFLEITDNFEYNTIVVIE